MPCNTTFRNIVNAKATATTSDRTCTTPRTRETNNAHHRCLHQRPRRNRIQNLAAAINNAITAPPSNHGQIDSMSFTQSHSTKQTPKISITTFHAVRTGPVDSDISRPHPFHSLWRVNRVPATRADLHRMTPHCPRPPSRGEGVGRTTQGTGPEKRAR